MIEFMYFSVYEDAIKVIYKYINKENKLFILNSNVSYGE